MSDARLWAAVRRDKNFEILVWGPGTDHSDHGIRLAIRDALRVQFATVEFSEDKVDATVDPNEWLGSIALQERLHASDASIVYVLATSPGPKLEAILFWEYADLGPKLHVLVRDNLSRGSSFLDAVFYAVVTKMPPHQVHRLPDAAFGPAQVANYCLDHAKALYVATHFRGPPGPL